MKVKSKKFIGYVPKGEAIKETIAAVRCDATPDFKRLDMYDSPRQIRHDLGQYAAVVKRTITISWHDEEVR